jgi:hypothetical protein
MLHVQRVLVAAASHNFAGLRLTMHYFVHPALLFWMYHADSSNTVQPQSDGNVVPWDMLSSLPIVFSRAISLPTCRQCHLVLW